MFKIFNKYLAILARGFYSLAFFDSSIRKDFEIIQSSISSKLLKNPALMNIVLLIEDKRFFKHQGVDTRAIVRATYKSLFCSRLEGGSTIEQQYVRLITGQRDVTLFRKVRECILAAKLSNTYSKRKILSSYLLNSRFAGGTKGIEELAYQAGIDLTLATVDELSFLVARLKYPFSSKTDALLLKRALMISKLSQAKVYKLREPETIKIAPWGFVSKI